MRISQMIKSCVLAALAFMITNSAFSVAHSA
jgi:hypothetical protein